MGSGHVGGRPGLVDEHEALGVEIELAFEPRLAALQDVRPNLFAGARSLFFGRDSVIGEEAANRAVADNTALLAERVAQLLDCDVRLRLHGVSVALHPPAREKSAAANLGRMPSIERR